MGVVIAAFLIAALILLLVSAGVEDARTREIANWKNAAIALLAIPWWFAIGMTPIAIGIQIGVALCVFALFVLTFYLGQMGGGDVKMLGALALWFPFYPLVSMLIAMSLIGGAMTLVMLIEHRLRRRTAALEIPYGIAIAIAALLILREPNFYHFG